MEVSRESRLEFIHGLRSVADSWSEYYLEEDTANATIGHFSTAVHEGILHHPHFRELIDEMVRFRPGIEPRYGMMLLLRGYQADQLSHNPDYPNGMQSMDAWLDVYDQVSTDDLRWALVRNNICSQQIQSNIAERYKSVKLIAELYKDRFDGPPSVLDFGSSMLHGDIKLAYSQNDPPRVPFGAINVMEQRGKTLPGKQDRLLQGIVNRILAKEVEFGPMMGVDITNIDDPVVKSWAKSCSFYPDELLQPQRVKEYNDLDTLDPNHERVRFFRGDFLELEHTRFDVESPVKQYDIAVFSTVLYQLATEEERAKVRVNAYQFMNPKGLVIIQDAPGGNFTKKYNYRTEVLDLANVHHGYQEVFTWENGRCQRMAPSIGYLAVGNEVLSVPEAFVRYAERK